MQDKEKYDINGLGDMITNMLKSATDKLDQATDMFPKSDPVKTILNDKPATISLLKNNFVLIKFDTPQQGVDYFNSFSKEKKQEARFSKFQQIIKIIFSKKNQ